MLSGSALARDYAQYIAAVKRDECLRTMQTKRKMLASASAQLGSQTPSPEELEAAIAHTLREATVIDVILGAQHG